MTPNTVVLPPFGQHGVHTIVYLAASGQHEVVMPPQLILRDAMVLLALPLCQAATTQVTDALTDICHLCLWSSSGEFPLSELSLPMIHYVNVCYSVLFLL